jgi:HK97 family phage major capsid protein
MADSKNLEQIIAEIKSTADELRGNIGEYKSIKAKVEELMALKDAVAALETKLGRPGAPDIANGGMSEAHKAFCEFIAKGRDAMPEAMKALVVRDDNLGGYLVPPEFSAAVIKRIFDFSPIRRLANVVPTSSNAVQWPKESGDIGASWVGENESSGDTQSTYKVGLETISVNKLVARVDISNDLLDMGAADAENLLRGRAAEKFGRTEGTAFVSGTGVKQPEGLMTNASVGKVAGGHASEIRTDGLLDLYAALKTGYDNNAVYLMSKATMVAVRKLKDTYGQYLWQPALADGMPPTFNGIPIVLCPDMDPIGANNFPVAYGDIRAAYTIVDSKQMTVLRDDLTQSDNDLVRFRFKMRVGGQVVQPEAVYKLKIATSV